MTGRCAFAYVVVGVVMPNFGFADAPARLEESCP